jgi:hypothetical protein
MGDGNCLFRSLSYLLFGNEDNHQQIHQLLVEFVMVNSHVLAKYCFSANIKEHIARMKYESVFGTYLKLRAAASYLQIPIYVCTQRSGTLKYHWDYIPPHPPVDLVPPTENLITHVPQVGHFEICHSCRCHYDTVEMLDGSRPSLPPLIQPDNGYMDLT